ncbi:CAP domain-containing protein [Streptomyces avidinii]|uniref:CAP domain-containing protein n=1 Tax=Streptomyces avidinii TaxID=1895 RepID=UPI00386C02C1|nr:CAP domain-containing protein [Streptomyces avidinii]
MSSRTPGTPSRVEARRKKTVRTRIVLSLTAAAAAVAVGVAVADSDGGTQVDQRADGATGAKSGTPAPGGTAGTASPTAPGPEITADAAAATGSLPPETPAATGSESAAPEKSAAEGGAPAKSTPASKPPRTSGGSTGGGSGSSGGSGSGGSTGGSSGGSGSSSGDSESAVLALVNKERSAAGCGPVTMNAKLSAAARGYSDTMARSGVMSHTGPDGSTMTTRVEAAGYAWSRLGENIARGQSDADAVMKAWMNSSGHRANILNCDFREIGIGVHKGDGGPWWTQNFGAPR